MKSIVMFALIAILGTGMGASSDGKQLHKKIEIRAGEGVMLGVVIQNVSEDRLKELNLKAGVEVRKVIPESAAEKMGLEDGDIITAVDGTSIDDPEQLQDLLQDKKEGDKVKLTLIRDGKKLTKSGKLKRLKRGAYSFSGDFGPGSAGFAMVAPDAEHLVELMERGNAKGAFLGVEAENLTDQLQKYFEVEYGVLVKKVLKDSPAEKSGIKAGDIITNISGKAIKDYNDLVRTVRYYDPNDEVKIHVTRKGSQKTINVKLGKQSRKYFNWRQKDGSKSFRFWNKSSGDDDQDVNVFITKGKKGVFGAEAPVVSVTKKLLIL